MDQYIIFMRLSFSLGSLLGIQDVQNCIAELAKKEPDTIWIPETWGVENFSMLSAVAAQTRTARIGSSIINIYSRSPSLIAMGAVTIDTISRGRFIIGLGTSSIPIVEDLHGHTFDSPVQRMREYVDIIRLATSGQRINYEGKFFKLRNFSLLIKPFRPKIPIYMAAVNQKMINLAWEEADGIILYLRPKSEMKKTIETMQAKRKIEVTCQVITAVSEDAERAILRAKKTLAFYIAVGKIYQEFLAANGYREETASITEEYKKSGLKNIHDFVTDSMIHDIAVCGTPEDARKQITSLESLGIDLPIIQFNPVGDVTDSFKIVQKTFSGT